jgi:hypothetical protein
MRLLEISAVKTSRRFFKNDYTRQLYLDDVSLCVCVGSATMLIKAVTVAL